jgi:LPXTG-site transpeptidase (sortase) family protein
MHLKQHYLRYLYGGAFLVILASIGLGRFAWMQFASTQTRAPLTTSSQDAIPPTHGAQLHHVTPTSVVSIHTDTAARLLIPAIGVDAPIEMVGQDSQGRMGVPTKNQWNGVGWYQNGTVPGAQGSAVIDGHLDTTTGAPAVFWKLGDLHLGDMVMVKDKTGHKAQFRVFKIQSYTLAQAPLDQIFAKNDGTYLNLITCSGSWDYSQNQFNQRLVVFTQLV